MKNVGISYRAPSGEMVGAKKTRQTKTASAAPCDHSERLTAIGVMWRGPGAARRPAAV
jgi:hypothetical protein